jgi:hypothetical protein
VHEAGQEAEEEEEQHVSSCGGGRAGQMSVAETSDKRCGFSMSGESEDERSRERKSEADMEALHGKPW